MRIAHVYSTAPGGRRCSKSSAGTNRLDYVFDAVTGDNYTEDIENTQSTGNYLYDEIGNLVDDADEGGMTMTWESGGRIKTVDHALLGATATTIDYVYDAGGNRVKKTVTETNGPIITAVTTYYVRDAAGTVIAIYEQECDPIADTDNDGIPNSSDNCPWSYNPEQLDFDNDGIGDDCDGDADGDNLADNGADNCLWDATNMCPPPSGIPTIDDSDNDSIVDAYDNCPNTWNPNQADTDGDGTGDVCDMDRDNDGTINDHDPCPEDEYDTCPDSCETRLVELPIYGLSRVGVLRPDITLDSVPNTTNIYTRDLTEKSYELTDHLGNVRGVISDRKLAGSPGTGDYYAEYTSYSHAYPYGMPQPGRTWADQSYRYGFNGMEGDPEVKNAEQHHFTTHFRQYDPRVGRWWSNDPVVHPWESSYSFPSGNPLYFSDPSGADGDPQPSGTIDPGLDTDSDVFEETDDDGEDGGCRTCPTSGDMPLGTRVFDRDDQGYAALYVLRSRSASGELAWEEHVPEPAVVSSPRIEHHTVALAGGDPAMYFMLMSDQPVQGETWTLYWHQILTSHGTVRFSRSATYRYHEGDDTAPAGFYHPDDYFRIVQDWEGGQVLPPLSGASRLLQSTRDWNGWQVDTDGYLNGLPTPVGGAGPAEFVGPRSGGRLFSRAVSAYRARQASREIAKIGSYTVYRGAKTINGETYLYIGKTGQGIRGRYTSAERARHQIQEFAELNGKIPNNGVALGVEQAIMELNGWRGAAANRASRVLSNKKNATNNEILRAYPKTPNAYLASE